MRNVRIPAALFWAFVSLAVTGCSTTYGLRLEPVAGDPLKPTFRWAAFPAPPDPEEDSKGAPRRINEVKYELKVICASDGRIVYSRRGLIKPKHTMTRPLAPETVFHWTVRPWFKLDGKQRVGPWSQAKVSGSPLVVGRRAQVPLPLDALASFRTPVWRPNG